MIYCPEIDKNVLYTSCIECDSHLCKKPVKTKALCVDMDGTIAKIHEEFNYLERITEKGFFNSLKPYKETIQIIKEAQDKGVEVFVISAISPESWNDIVKDKDEWLDKELNIPKENRIFVPIGANKAAELKRRVSFSKSTVLLDDYNKNLEEWEMEGGTSIKFVNEINDKGQIGPLWEGLRIKHDSPSYEALKTLLYHE